MGITEDVTWIMNAFQDKNFLDNISDDDLGYVFLKIAGYSYEDPEDRIAIINCFLRSPSIMNRISGNDLALAIKNSVKVDDDRILLEFMNQPEIFNRISFVDNNVFNDLMTESWYVNFVNHENFLELIKKDNGKFVFDYLFRKGIDFNQSHLIRKMREYVEVEHERRKIEGSLGKEELSDIEIFLKSLNKGNCSGFTLLYASYKMAGAERAFFEKLKKISKANPKKSFTPDEKTLFEEIISHIILAQDDFHVLEWMKRTRERQSDPSVIIPLLSSSIKIFIDHSLKEKHYSFKELIEVIQTLPEGKAIEVGSRSNTGLHSTCIYRTENKYYFYDPNSHEGERNFGSSESMAQALMDSVLKGPKKVLTDSIKFEFNVFSTPSSNLEFKEKTSSEKSQVLSQYDSSQKTMIDNITLGKEKKDESSQPSGFVAKKN